MVVPYGFRIVAEFLYYFNISRSSLSMKYNQRVLSSLRYKIFKKLVAKNHSNLANKNLYFSVFLNDFVSDAIQTHGLYEGEILIPLFRIFSKNFDFSQSTAIDIGANIGNHTVFFSDKFKRVICFEPNPITFKLLTVNTFQLNNVLTVNLGLSDNVRELSLSVVPGGIAGSSASRHYNNGLKHKIEVIRLDDFQQLPGNIELIKIDVEGMETEVLYGAKKIIISNRPIILFEQWASQFSEGHSDATNFLTDFGYSMFTLVESNYTNNKWLRRIKRFPLMVINGSLKYKLQKISYFDSISYATIIAIHKSKVPSDILLLE